jgi:hypothetical protein
MGIYEANFVDSSVNKGNNLLWTWEFPEPNLNLESTTQKGR